MHDGSLVSPGTESTLKYDWKNNKCTVSTSLTNSSVGTYGNTFKTLAVDIGVEIPESMKALALYPANSNGYEENYFYVANSGERFPIRGGNWNNGSNAGIFDVALNNLPSNFNNQIGFRCAYFDSH